MNIPSTLLTKLGPPRNQNDEYVSWVHCYDNWASMNWKVGSRYAKCQNCGVRIATGASFKDVPTALRACAEAEDRPSWISPLQRHRHYLLSRGLTEDEIDTHFCADLRLPSYTIAPIEQEGIVVQYHGRHIRDGMPKYISGRTIAGWQNQHECVWGLDRLQPGQPAYVCEGIFDALYFPTGVAVMGSKIPVDKAMKIIDRVPSRIILCMDRDEQEEFEMHPGKPRENPDKEWAWMQAFQALDIHLPVQILYPPEGKKDFGELLTKRRYEIED